MWADVLSAAPVSRLKSSQFCKKRVTLKTSIFIYFYFGSVPLLQNRVQIEEKNKFKIAYLTTLFCNISYIGCSSTYQTRQFCNNSKTNEDIATRFEQEYVRCVRNEKECVCSKIMSVCVCSKIMSVCVCSKIIKELPGLVGSGTPYINWWLKYRC